MQQIHLGSFNTEEEAARAFDQEAIRLRGTATYTNFPAEDYVVDDWAHRSERLHAQQKRPQSTSRYSEANATLSWLCSYLALNCWGN